MRIVGFGQVLFALSVALLGVLGLVSGDFALVWQPVPAWVPGRLALAYASGAILLIFGVGLVLNRTARLSAMVLTANFVIWLLLLKLPLVTSLLDEGGWLGVGETSVLVAGAWALLVTLSDQAAPAFGTGPVSLRLLRILLGLALPLIGLSHFIFLKETVAFIPTYIPDRPAFAYFTGAAHIATGLAILSSIIPRFAVTMEAIMMGLFTLMVWAPRVIATPTSRFNTTAFLVSLALTAGAFAVADTYRGQAWFAVGARKQSPAAAVQNGRALP